DAPLEESMELDYANNSLVPTNPSPEMAPQVIPSPSDTAVATNVAIPAVPKAGPSGSSDMANAVLEHWEGIMSNEEAVASKMDEWVG
ncbi:hypothetical protein C0989_010975, partial [Termitomyces sp. Mn162]